MGARFARRPGRLLRSLLWVGLVQGLAACADGTDRAAHVEQALAATSAARVRDDMLALADDGMAGRQAGTAGHEAAAAYVAARFREIGLEPAGTTDSYLQDIDFMEARLVPGSASLVLSRDGAHRELRLPDDFVMPGGFGLARDDVEAALAYVGFGIRAAQYGHDDYAGIDVRGKVLVVLSGAPPSFATDERAYYSSGSGKHELAASLGAAGVITVRTPVDQQRLPWSRYVAAVGSPDLRWLDDAGTPRDGFPTLAAQANLSESAAMQLFEFAGMHLDELFARADAGENASVDLGITARLQRASAQRVVRSPNVIARLPGSDPELRDEYVLYTAHLDHLGVRPGTDGDDIHNGAYDNAAGVAVMLDVARAMAALPAAPRRSVLFAAVTAEEMGLRGSDYLARHLPFPADRLVANINIDMPYLGFPVAEVHGLGAEHSTLAESLRAAAVLGGLAATPDPRPELVRFIRSDQFSFVKQGIPGLNLKPGSATLDASIDGAALLNGYLQDHYHRASDDAHLPYDPDAALRFTRSALLLGLNVANDDARPRWQDGDFFGGLFGKPPGAEPPPN